MPDFSSMFNMFPGQKKKETEEEKEAQLKKEETKVAEEAAAFEERRTELLQTYEKNYASLQEITRKLLLEASDFNSENKNALIVERNKLSTDQDTIHTELTKKYNLNFIEGKSLQEQGIEVPGETSPLRVEPEIAGGERRIEPPEEISTKAA
jgi:hypothetical protein